MVLGPTGAAGGVTFPLGVSAVQWGEFEGAVGFLGPVFAFCPHTFFPLTQGHPSALSTYPVAPSLAWGLEVISHGTEAAVLLLGKVRGARSLGKAWREGEQGRLQRGAAVLHFTAQAGVTRGVAGGGGSGRGSCSQLTLFSL